MNNLKLNDFQGQILIQILVISNSDNFQYKLLQGTQYIIIKKIKILFLFFLFFFHTFSILYPFLNNLSLNHLLIKETIYLTELNIQIACAFTMTN
ncbi:hypothetical protein pb186bvf_015295 [Paramecium bursaria]